MLARIALIRTYCCLVGSVLYKCIMELSRAGRDQFFSKMYPLVLCCTQCTRDVWSRLSLAINPAGLTSEIMAKNASLESKSIQLFHNSLLKLKYSGMDLNIYNM